MLMALSSSFCTVLSCAQLYMQILIEGLKIADVVPDLYST
jgi:hypothetical protein